MEFIIFAGGVAAGVIVVKMLDRRTKTYGVIDVDHDSEMCKVHITSDELSDRRNKKATFTINHEASISREEHIL